MFFISTISTECISLIDKFVRISLGRSFQQNCNVIANVRQIIIYTHANFVDKVNAISALTTILLFLVVA